MANTNVKTQIDLDIKITLELTIPEAKALNEMVKYGTKAFLEGYYKQLGKSYLQPHERGVISLFETVKNTLPSELYKVDKIVKTVSDIKANII